MTFLSPSTKSRHLGQESGCGKSVTAQSVLRIIPKPGQIKSGSILFHAIIKLLIYTELTTKTEVRGMKSYDFPEPMTPLSSVHTPGNQIQESTLTHFFFYKKVSNILLSRCCEVGIPMAEKRFDSYPHHLSGGMRQRDDCHGSSCSLVIDREPTTALDVTVQAQILQLMEFKSSTYEYAYISQDLERWISQIILLLCILAESLRSSKEKLFSEPKHPHTCHLLRAFPRLGYSTEINNDRRHADITNLKMNVLFSVSEEIDISNREFLN